MDKLILLVGLLCYVTKAVVVVSGHFSSATTPRGVRFGIIASSFGVGTFIYLMLRDKHAIGTLVAALAIFVASLALLLWAAKTSRSKRLKLAFDPEAPGTVLRTGPYRYVRHPFYASCILF